MTFGVPASWRAGPPSQSASLRRTRARRHRRAGGARPVEPVAPADEGARAERGVELVAREARRGRRRAAARSMRRWGASWAASTHDPGAVARAPRRRSPRAASAHRSRCCAPVTATSHRRPRRAGNAAASRVGLGGDGGSRANGRRRHGSRLAWCSTASRGPSCRRQGAGEEVERVGRVPGEDDEVVGPRADERADLRRLRRAGRCTRSTRSPAPRWTLLYHGSSSSTAAATATSAGALAARSRLTARTAPTVDEGDLRGRRRHVEQRARDTGGGSASGDGGGHGGLSSSGSARSALARRVPWPGRHPEHPTARRGLLASEPGLGAGPRDLRHGYHAESRLDQSRIRTYGDRARNSDRRDRDLETA